MSPKKRKNFKQTKLTNIKGIKTKKTQAGLKPKEDINRQEKFQPHEEQMVQSVFPVTFDEFIEHTNIIDVIKDYIKDKHPTDFQTYLTEPEIMVRAQNTYIIFYKRPQRRLNAPLKYIRITSDCEENTKERLFKIPEQYKELYENKVNEHRSAKNKLKKQDSSSNKNKNTQSVNDRKTVEEKIQVLKSIISNFDVNNRETNIKECNLPVSFETFKRYTFYNVVIDNICQSLKEFEYDLPISNISKEELLDPNTLLRSYYKTFYMQTDIRRIFPLRVKPCPGCLKDKLLKYAEITLENKETVISNESNKKIDDIKVYANVPNKKGIKLESKTKNKNVEKFSLALEIKAAKDDALHQQKQNESKSLSPISKSPKLNTSSYDFSTHLQKQDHTKNNTGKSNMDEKTSNEKIQVLSRLKSFIIPNFDDKNAELQKHNPPVSLEIFKKYTLYNEVIDQIYQDMVHTDCALIILNPSEEKFLNRDRLLQSYYKAFYFQPNIRKLYHLRVKPCPAHLKAKLLSLPKKMFNVASENDSTSSENNGNVDHNIIASVGEPLNKKTKLNQALQIKAAKENTERNSIPYKNKFETKTTKSPESTSPAKILLWKENYPNETKQTSPKAIMQRNETQNSSTCIMEPIISSDKQNEVVKDSTKYHLVPCPSNLRAKLGNSVVKNNGNAVVLPKGPQLTTKYDDSKFSLKFQDFLMGTNVLDLLIKTCNSTDDELVNLAFQYYIKFVTNPNNQNVELFKNLMIHANKKLVNQFYNLYNRNKEDATKQVKALADIQKPKPNKPIKKKNRTTVSLAEFKKNTHYKDVIIEILKERAKGDEEVFSKLRKNKLEWKKALRLYYTNFYFKSSISNKYTLRLKGMPQSLKDKISEVPTISTTVKKINTPNHNQKGVNTKLVKTHQPLNIMNPILTTTDKTQSANNDHNNDRVCNADNSISSQTQIPEDPICMSCKANTSNPNNTDLNKNSQYHNEKENQKELNTKLVETNTAFNITNPSVKTEDIPSIITQCANNENDKDGVDNVDDSLSSQASQAQLPEDPICMSYKANTSNSNNTEIIKSIKEEPTVLKNLIFTLNDNDQMSCHSFQESAIDLLENDSEELPSQLEAFIKNVKMFKT